LAQRYGIMTIPTLLVFKNGELTAKSVGVISRDEIVKLIG
ncbi:MAG: thioredoxin family protein, partial [Lachnospiraceae bacterium]